MKRVCLWFAVVLIVGLLGVSVAGAQQGTPAQIFFALDDLSSRLGRTVRVSDLQAWSYRIETYSTADLGCPTFTGQGNALNRLVEVYIFDLSYRNTTYQYRVTADGSIKLWCGQSAYQPSVVPATPTAAATVTPTAEVGECPADFAGYLTPRLEVGGQATLDVGSTPSRVRQSPGINAEQVGILNGGAVADVIGGPLCGDELVWWQVSFLNIEGWTAEGELPDTYFVEPVEAAEATPEAFTGLTLPEERSVIGTANAADLVELGAIPVGLVNDLAFATDGGLLLVGSTDGASTYEFPSGLPLELTVPVPETSAVAVSSDGRYLAFGTFAGEIVIVDTEEESTVSLVASPEAGAVNILEFSSVTPYRLAAVQGYSPEAGNAVVARVYAIPAGEVTLERDVIGDFGGDAAFNADATRLYYTDTALHEVNLDTSTEVRGVSLQSPVFSPIAVQPVTGAVAFADGASVRLVDAANVERGIALPNAASATGIAFSPDGTLLAVQSRIQEGDVITSTLSVFDAETGDTLFEMPNIGAALAFSPDGTLLLVASQGAISVYGVIG
jgi:WD40 repeat protein